MEETKGMLFQEADAGGGRKRSVARLQGGTRRRRTAGADPGIPQAETMALQMLNCNQCCCRGALKLQDFSPLSAPPSASFRLLSAKEKGGEREQGGGARISSSFLGPPRFLKKKEDRCCLFVTDGNPDLNAAGFLQRVHFVMHKRKSKLPLQPVPTYTARWRPLARNCCKKIHAKDVEAGGEREGGGKGGR